MKLKVLIISLFTLFIYDSSFAQLGMRGGIGLSWTANTMGGNQIGGGTNIKPGLVGGLTYRSEIDRLFDFYMDVLYASKGGRIGLQQAGAGYNLELNYINVPLLCAFKPEEHTAVFFGGEGGFLLSAKQSALGNKSDVSSAYNKFEAGLVLGARYTLDSGFFLDFRYIHGLTNIGGIQQTGGNVNTVNPSNFTKNRTSQFTIGYIFNYDH